MAYHRLQSIVDQHLTQDMAMYQLSQSLVSVGYYVNVEARSSIAHFHPYYELILVRRGVCEYHANSVRFLLRPDELLLLAPGTVHTMLCTQDGSSYERLILQVNAAFMEQVFCDCGQAERLQNLQPLFILRADAVCRWGVRELFERINATAAVTDAALRERLYRCQLGELLLTIAYTADSAGAVEFRAASRLITDVTLYIQEHFREPELSVAHLAQQFYVSREHLSRSFRSDTGESISRYLTDLRMQEFRYCLLMGRSILSACMESGFSDYSSFVKTFRKLYGITPADYREQLNRALHNARAGSGGEAEGTA